jgi:membrane fusion protein (multidrug efflux system)
MTFVFHNSSSPDVDHRSDGLAALQPDRLTTLDDSKMNRTISNNGHIELTNKNRTSPPDVAEGAERNLRDASPEKPVTSETAKSRGSRTKWVIGGIVAGIIVIVGTLFWLRGRNYQSTDDAYTTAHVHEISGRVAGYVQSVNVDDNQFVKAGQTLVVLDQSDYKVALEQAQAQVLQRQSDVDQARANYDRAKLDYDRSTELYSRKVISKSEIDRATAAFKAASGALGSTKANLAAAEAARNNAQLQLSYTTIVAPVDGVVGKKTVETGARIQPGQALMAVVERDVWVLGNFKETQLARMRVGQHVEVAIDAVPDHKFSAHIDSLQPGTGATFSLLPPDNATGNFTKIVQRVPVKIVFDELGSYRNRVVPGMSCTPKIDLGPRKDS